MVGIHTLQATTNLVSRTTPLNREGKRSVVTTRTYSQCQNTRRDQSGLNKIALHYCFWYATPKYAQVRDIRCACRKRPIRWLNARALMSWSWRLPNVLATPISNESKKTVILLIRHTVFHARFFCHHSYVTWRRRMAFWTTRAVRIVTRPSFLPDWGVWRAIRGRTVYHLKHSNCTAWSTRSCARA